MSAIDIKCVAQSVVNSMTKDNVSDTFLELNKSDRADMSNAYMVHAVKKFETFQTKYLTNPEARRAFATKVFLTL